MIFCSAFLCRFLELLFLYHFSEVPVHTFVKKRNCTTTFHLVNYSVVKEHFRADSLGLFIR